MIKMKNRGKSLRFSMVLIACVVVVALFSVISPYKASALQNGDVLGNVLYSDIVAYINGYAVPTSIINGVTLVVVEDLAHYGFDVVWNQSARTLRADLNTSKKFTPIDVPINTRPSGTVKGQYFYTDIKTYMAGLVVDSYAISGVTLMDFELLKRYGTLTWNNTLRELRLVIPQTPPTDPGPSVPSGPNPSSSFDLLYSDKIAYINNHAIPSGVTSDGKIMITVEDLKNYGFDVAWNANLKALTVEQNKSKAFTPLTVSTNAYIAGTLKDRYSNTTTRTYLAGQEVGCFGASGKTLIDFNELKKFGVVVENSLDIRLTMETNNIDFRSVVANGSPTDTTTQLTLTFDRAIPGLTAADISVSGASKGVLTGVGPVYYLNISNIVNSGNANLTVSVNKTGYTFNQRSQIVMVYNSGYTFQSLAANGSTNEATTQLTMTFDKPIPGFSLSDIQITGATATNLLNSGSTYYVIIKDITVQNRQQIEVRVNKAGYTFSPASRNVVVYKPATTFLSLTDNGSPTSNTTEIMITLGQNVQGFNINDITVTGATKGNLRQPDPQKPTYILSVTGIIRDNTAVTVLLNKSGYDFSPSSRNINARLMPNTVTMQNIMPNGKATTSTVDGETTTKLTIMFDKLVPGLTLDDFVIDGATKSKLNPPTHSTISIYELEIKDIKVKDGEKITVKVAKATYHFNNNPQSVVVYNPPTVTAKFTSVTQNGTDLSPVTTQFTLYFDKPVIGLTKEDIQIEDAGITKVALTSIGTGLEWRLTVALSNNVADNTTVLVWIKNINGFVFDPWIQTVKVRNLANSYIFTGAAAANGNSTTPTTELTLTFDKDPGLTENNIGVNGATVGTLTRIGTSSSYKLTISNITSTNNLITVTVTKFGYTFTPASQNVTVFKGSTSPVTNFRIGCDKVIAAPATQVILLIASTTPNNSSLVPADVDWFMTLGSGVEARISGNILTIHPTSGDGIITIYARTKSGSIISDNTLVIDVKNIAPRD